MSEERARPLIQPHLWAGEEVQWCDQPVAAGPVASAAARKGFYGAMGAAAGVFVFSLFARGAFREVDSEAYTILPIAGAVAAALVLAFGAVSAWSRSRRLIHLVAYAITNRRIVMVQGEEVQWVGLRELEDARIDGNDVMVRRGQTETEQLWARQGENRPPVAKADVVAREVVLAALPDPHRVAVLIQTLKRSAAS
ncbi:MAG: hypothetical protein DMD48_08620 [Gemmatimonadetes bacterium]|nr:MAG: hypothetical protein DMD48_08620 [Gemmatimonadota bacterium]